MRRAQREYAWAFTFASIVAIFAAVVLWNMGRERNSSDEFRLTHAGNEISLEEVKAVREATPDPIESPLQPARRTGADESVAPAPVSEPGSPEVLPGKVTDYTPQVAVNQSASDDRTAEPVRESEPSGYARSIARPSFGPTIFAPGVGGLVGAVASSAGVKGSAESTGGSGRAEPQNTSRRAKLGELADSPPASTADSGTSTSSVPSMSNWSPEAVASLGTVGLPSAPVDAASVPALVLSSAVIDSADPARAELLLAESVLADAGLVESLVSDYNNPIKVIQESTAGVETPVFDPAIVADTPTVNPEPASLLLLGSGLGFIAHRLRRREQKQA